MDTLKQMIALFCAIVLASAYMTADEIENPVICENSSECSYCASRTLHAREIWPEMIGGWTKSEGLEYKTGKFFEVGCIVADYQNEILKNFDKRVWGDIEIPEVIEVNDGMIDVIGVHGFSNCEIESLIMPVGIREIDGITHFSGLKSLELPSGVRRVTGVSYSEDLEELILPDNPINVYDAFHFLQSLKLVMVKCPDPYSLQKNTFFRTPLGECTLVVPAGSLEAYCNAEVWKEFGVIMDSGGSIGKKEPSPVFIPEPRGYFNENSRKSWNTAKLPWMNFSDSAENA